MHHTCHKYNNKRLLILILNELHETIYFFIPFYTVLLLYHLCAINILKYIM